MTAAAQALNGSSLNLEIDEAAACMEALGNPKRLEIVRLLVWAGDDGLAVGEVQRHLGIPASTLSHHILHLVGAGLVRQEREGRTLRCRPDFARLRGLAETLFAECCSGVGLQTSETEAV